MVTVRYSFVLALIYCTWTIAITRDHIEEIVLQILPTVYFRPFLGILFQNVSYLF
jgi:hypothetical protein